MDKQLIAFILMTIAVGLLIVQDIILRNDLRRAERRAKRVDELERIFSEIHEIVDDTDGVVTKRDYYAACVNFDGINHWSDLRAINEIIREVKP